MPALGINIQAWLSRIALFNELPEDELANIAGATREVFHTKGEFLFHKGDPCHGFHLIVAGQVKLAFGSPDGSEKVVEILGPGQTFGEALMFMDQPYPLFAQALMDTTLLMVPKQAIFEELEAQPHFCHKMLAGLSMRLHQLIRDVESYSLRSGRQRVIGYLLQAASEFEHEAGEKVTVHLPANKGVIASRLNVTQEHFSRILHELIEQGLIKVESRNIHIPDPERLRSFDLF